MESDFLTDIDYKNTDSLGLRLVTSLAEQIDGEIELNNISGTTFKITFPIHFKLRKLR